MGPSPIQQGTSHVNGRVSAIAVHPYNPNVIYLGASGGGVWRTINGGATWRPLYDQQVSLGVGEPSAIAIDPSDTNTMYVGTSARFVLNLSKGILKSTDGGGSWIVLGDGFPADNVGNADNLFAGQFINTIIVDPANSNVLYLGATNGLFRSTDAGRNWTPGTNGGGDARSLVLDTSTPAGARRLYAGVSSSGVRQSTDGGQTWTQILNSATPAVSTALGAGGFGHVVVALAPPTSPPNANGVQVLYVTMTGFSAAPPAAPTPDPVGIFLSTDQGVNWVQQTATGLPSGTQGGYDLTMGVDPASPGDGAGDIIYYGAVGHRKSTDAGATFSSIDFGQHPDSHTNWVFFPQPSPTPSIVFEGNDGGIWRSTDGGAHWSGTGLPGAPPTINAGGLQTALFYNLDIKNDATASLTEGSTQDNGTPRTTGGLTWTDTQGGDGWDIAFDAVTTNNAYNSSGFWSPAPCTRAWKSTDSGGSWPSDVTPWGVASDQGCYLAPVNADPSTADIIYVSGNQNLWQTRDGGGSWRVILNQGGAQVKVAKANSNNVVASVGARVFVSTSALATTVGPPTGVTFTNITRNLPPRFVTRVAFDPNDPTVIYATLSGFNSQTPGQPGHVFRTTIGGTAWTNISPALDIPFNAIVLDGVPAPSTIFVGTDLGVIRSVDDGASWSVLDDVHFPNVPVTDLVINAQAGVLRAATFGRGVFELKSPDGPVISVNAEAGLQFGSVCQGTAAKLTIQVFNVGNDNLVINSVQRLFGSAGFSVLPGPSTPLIISPNAEVDFTVIYTPTTAVSESALIRIASNDPGAPAFDILATGSGGAATIATLIADSGAYGDVCVGTFKGIPLTISNSGTCNLRVTNIVSSSSQFQTASVVSLPLVVEGGTSLQVPIRFQPTSLGPKTATLTVSSNDPVSPIRLVSVSGNVPPGDIRVTGSTTFGEVCGGTKAEQSISVNNTGTCNLNVTSASLSCPEFTIINNPFPAKVSPDSHLDLTVRFTPTSAGPKTCSLAVNSDDPDTPVVTLPVTGTTPAASIDVAANQAFLPEVIQSVGVCTASQPFPISNTGTCNLKITNVAIGGPDAGDYKLSGLPSFPITLEPGHVASDGALQTVFAPTALDRDRLGALTVSYVSDPITGTTTNVTRNLCGEGVRTGTRVLVRAGGVPVSVVEKFHLQRLGGNRNKDLLDTQDVAQNLALQTVTPAAPCVPFQFHREYGTVSNPIQLLPGDYQVTATAIVNGKRSTLSVGFSVNTCDFNPTVIIDF